MAGRVVFVSTYPPRRCGLAEFTHDLRSAMSEVAAEWRTAVCAVDRDGLAYGSAVQITVRQDVREDYARAAREIARRRAAIVVIEHEFGIFGGPAGSYVLDLAYGLQSVGVPYLVTLHTVRPRAPRLHLEVTTALCRNATLVTVFTHEARRLVAELGIADVSRTVVVPHGAPTVLRDRPEPPDGGALSEALAALSGARIITSFGLIKPAKGLERVIQALPEITRRHPDVHYVIAGATHPEVVRHSGEEYRQQLRQLTADLGVADNVRFVNQFLSEAELGWLLSRAELCVTPYLAEEQISSGVLTFALAAGCPVVSTDYSYARQLLLPVAGVAPGVIVPRRNSRALSSVITELLGDPVQLAASREAARQVGSVLLWPQVVRQFADVLALARGAAQPQRPGHRGERAQRERAHRAGAPPAQGNRVEA